MPDDRTKALINITDEEPRTPTILEADIAAGEAETLCDLLFLASCNDADLDSVNEDTFSSGLLMLSSRQQVMSAFIAKKREEERAFKDDMKRADAFLKKEEKEHQREQARVLKVAGRGKRG